MAVASSQVLEIVKATLVADNTQRTAAEKTLQEAKSNAAPQLVVGLFCVVQEASLEQHVREQGAVLLRQCLASTKEAGSLWAKLGPEGHGDVRRRLLQQLEAEPVDKVRRKVADCIEYLGNQLIDLSGVTATSDVSIWPELLPTLLRLTLDTSRAVGLRADCLWTVQQLTPSIWPVLLANRDQTCQVLQACLASGEPPLVVGAGALLLDLAECIEGQKDREFFKPIALQVASKVPELAALPDPTQACALLQCLGSTQCAAELFRESLPNGLLQTVHSIALSHAEESARTYACEVLMSFAESRPKALQKVPGFFERCYEVAAHFTGQLEEDVDAWAADEDEEDEGEDLFRIGRDSIDRISRSLNEAELFTSVLEGYLKPAIQKLFSAGDWKSSVVGLVFLQQLGEYVDDEASVSQMFGVIHQHLAAGHPRVRYAAWTAVAQFSINHSETVTSDTWKGQLLQRFAASWGAEEGCWKVCLRAMTAFQHYGESCEREDLEPFVQLMMKNLGLRLAAGTLLVQRKAITCIAVLAGQMEEGFAAYYPQVMPLLKQTIERTLHLAEERHLLGRCFECMSLLASAVGRQGFQADAEVIMKAMLTAVQTPGLPKDDPVREYTLAASERICQVMKEDFLPFVPHLLPGVLEKLKLTPQELTSLTRDQFGENATVNLSVLQVDGETKVFIMSTSEMEDLKNALDCLHTFVKELEKRFAPFVTQTAQALVPVFDFDMDEEIRDLAFETWGQLCSACRASGEGEGMELLNQLTMEFMRQILPRFAEREVNVEAFKTRCDGVTTCLKKAGPGVLKAEEVKHIGEAAVTLILESRQRRSEAAAELAQQRAARGGPDEDEELMRQIHGEASDEDEVALCVAATEIEGALMEHHPNFFTVQLGEAALAQVLDLMQQVNEPDDRKLAWMVASDLLEHLGSRMAMHWDKFLPLMLMDIKNAHVETRHAACYGIGQAARDPAFAPQAAEAAQLLADIVAQTRNMPKKKALKPAQSCADVALYALLLLLDAHSTSLPPALVSQIWSVWTAGLPCQEEETEGEKCHAGLLRLIREQRQEVIGDGQQNLPKLIQILVEIYKTDMASEALSANIGRLLADLGANLEVLAQGLSDTKKKKLQRILREAATAGAAPAA